MAPTREVIAANEETLTRQSRSFAIPILRLDDRFRHAVMVEYNLNKTVDTIEDSEALDRDEKVGFTEEFCDALEREVVPEKVRRRMLEVTPPAEAFVFENWDATMALFGSLEPGERELAKKWTARMARGMSGFQEKPIETAADLNDYCYYVAGTVGMYLTGLLRLRRKPAPLHSINTLMLHHFLHHFPFHITFYIILRGARNSVPPFCLFYNF